MHLNSSNGLSRSANVSNRWQTDRETDHAIDKCVGISEIFCTFGAISPNNLIATNDVVRVRVTKVLV